MATFIAIAGLMFAAGSFVYDALGYHRKDRKGPTTTATQPSHLAPPSYSTDPPVHNHPQQPAQGISWPEAAYPPQRSPRPRSLGFNKQPPRWVFVSSWVMAGLIVVGEVVGYLNRGHDLGWLGLSAAGACLAVAVPLVIRLGRTADDDYIGPVIGVLFWVLVVLSVASFFPEWTLLEFTWEGGHLRIL
ncbi:hypothetical protein [Nonomuraea jabiensis]|uniref:Uncharacterized protein n=1 Tax=Nonomuraea jabiensis TaxID=882448 RepID=A0A7W9GCF7_9ACTN|nr:hypothetical protein [Nonomuraea jabiensis]MBB5781086.1 hypothetical protein [Nonomuraea jabiensis]